MNGWLPQDDDAGMFGVDRAVDPPPLRFRLPAAPPRSFSQKLRDAWLGMVNGFRYGASDE